MRKNKYTAPTTELIKITNTQLLAAVSKPDVTSPEDGNTDPDIPPAAKEHRPGYNAWDTWDD